jgi:hypothetical protein
MTTEKQGIVYSDSLLRLNKNLFGKYFLPIVSNQFEV